MRLSNVSFSDPEMGVRLYIRKLMIRLRFDTCEKYGNQNGPDGVYRIGCGSIRLIMAKL